MGLSQSDRSWLATITAGDVRFDEPMSRHTTLKVGGPADALATPRTVESLQAVIRGAAERGLPLTPVGGGSNLLVRDGGVRGICLATRRLRAIEEVGELGLTAEAGVSTGKLLSVATRRELGGLEFLGGVPGSVGGGLIMNAGTYLGEFKDVTTRVCSVRLTDGELVERAGTHCGFVYRGSALPRDEIVVRGEFELRPRPADEIKADVRSLRDRRNEREPKKVSNAGSVFKNPSGDHAGRLLEAAGLKGTRAGAAEISPVHANWFVNTGGATARDLLELIDLARLRVQEDFGVTLELEWKIIGEDLDA